jgi:hypothetical protein
LADWLIGIRRQENLIAHPQRGALFENSVMTELLTPQTNRGIKPRLHFLRDTEGHEIDAFVETAPKWFHAVEIKSGETVATDFFKGLDYWRAPSRMSLSAHGWSTAAAHTNTGNVAAYFLGQIWATCCKPSAPPDP